MLDPQNSKDFEVSRDFEASTEIVETIESATLPPPLAQTQVLYLKVNLGSFADFVDCICNWAAAYKAELPAQSAPAPAPAGRYVCIAPVAVCMESFWDQKFRSICSSADLVTPDGRPIVWALRRLGYQAQEQVSGPDLMIALCHMAAQRCIPIGLYGGSAAGLEQLQQNLRRQFPNLNIAYASSPPFRPAGTAAPQTELEAIRQSGAQLLFVGIGCPKQEIWMAQHKDALPLVMLGVGAAFLFHSGELWRAPLWLRRIGLEWLFRFLQEPKRLFKRYFKTNLAYLWHTRLLSARALRKYLGR